MTEGDAGSGFLAFGVTLSSEPAEESDVNIAWTTQAGTASEADGDFTADSGTLIFTHGQPLVQQIDIAVHGDTKPEPDETFTVVLSNATHAELGNNTAVDPSSPATDDTGVGSAPIVDIGAHEYQ